MSNDNKKIYQDILHIIEHYKDNLNIDDFLEWYNCVNEKNIKVVIIIYKLNELSLKKIVKYFTKYNINIRELHNVYSNDINIFQNNIISVFNKYNIMLVPLNILYNKFKNSITYNHITEIEKFSLNYLKYLFNTYGNNIIYLTNELSKLQKDKEIMEIIHKNNILIVTNNFNLDSDISVSKKIEIIFLSFILNL